MRFIIQIIALILVNLATAQIGIGNSVPKATLDVNKDSYVTGEQAGIAVTQQTAEQIEAMTTTDLKPGTLVYATTATGTTVNTLGYWNWNGTAWVKTGGLSSNLYNADGTLSTNRIVNLDGKILNFEGSVPVYFSNTSNTSNVIAPSVPVSKFSRYGNNGESWNQVVDFAIGKYNSGVNANTQLDIKMTNGGVNTPDVTVMSILGNGNVGIGITNPTESLEVNGNIRTNSVILNSDINLKKDIQPISNVLNNLSNINSYSYYFKKDIDSKELQFGLLAQEVQKIYPNLVSKNGEHLGVNYNQLIPLLIQALKELQVEIEDLKSQIGKK